MRAILWVAPTDYRDFGKATYMTSFQTVGEAWRQLRNGDDAEARAAAIVYLGENRYAPAVPLLTEFVRESDPGTRYLAAKALGQIGDEAEAALPTLLEELRGNDMFLRAAVTGALIKIGPPAVPGLTSALFDPSSAVKRAACKALGKIGSERAVPALKFSLRDGNDGVRKLAREALERIDSPAAREALRRRLRRRSASRLHTRNLNRAAPVNHPQRNNPLRF